MRSPDRAEFTPTLSVGRVNSATRRAWAWAVIAVAVLLVWLSVIQWPHPISPELDSSWQAALVDAHEQGRSFGNGIIFTAGPLGFLTSAVWTTEALPVKLAWELGGKLLLVLVFFAAIRPFSITRQALLALCIVGLSNFFPDTFFTFLIALLVLRWVLPRDGGIVRLAGAIVLLALLAQFKFTHSLLALAGAGIATLARASECDWRRAMATLGLFAAAYLGWWLSAGQNPVRLWDYWRYSWQLSAGYASAMSFNEAPRVLGCGLVIAFANLATGWHLWRTATDRVAGLASAGFLCVAWLLAWKHGYTRADGHVLAFFLFSMLCALTIPALLAASARRFWLELTAPLCVIAICVFDPNLLRHAAKWAAGRVADSVVRIVRLPAQSREFAARVAMAEREHAKPAWQKTVGAASVDLLNYEQGLLLLNHLNYRPRPIPQGYSVYTLPLLHKNLGFFRSARAPEFVIVRLNSIDGRYPTQDDSLVLADLPRRYEVVHVDGDGAILKRRSAQPPSADPAVELLFSRHTALGQNIDLPADPGFPLWLQAAPALTKLGRMRALFYRPPQLFLVCTSEGGDEARFRIVPAIAEAGFLLSPQMENGYDYAAFVNGRGSAGLKSIRFESEEDGDEFWSSIAVRVSILPDWPLVSRDPLEAIVDARISNVIPESVHSTVTVQHTQVGDRRGLLVHSTGVLNFKIEAPFRELRGCFGIAEGAYTNDGHTDGVEFAIECHHISGEPQTVFHRSLDPLRAPTDRGPQAFVATLPPGTVKVVLHTRPGPAANTDWDWSFWSGLEFVR